LKKEQKFPKLAKKEEIEKIKELFLKHYPDSVTELTYSNLFELLVAVMLSAQCTDKRVNMLTPTLFKKYPTIKDLAEANLDDVKEIIKSCSFFNNKAKNLIALSKMIIEKYNGKVPLEQKELIKLPGVGQKTANVILIEYTGANLMAVDTHVFRVAHRLGLSRAKSAKDTEADLAKKFKTNLHQLHQAMVLFGRYKCKAIKPECEDCFLAEFCKSKESFKAL
jgi:endonuclease-3